MMRSADEYKRAWEQLGSLRARYNSRIMSGTCVLETLSMVNEPEMRYFFVDDFGYALAYCRQRLREDLIPPDQRGGGESLERWLRMRSAFTPAELASAWAAADTAFSLLLDTFVASGYTRTLGDRLREIVNTCGLDLELGEIYVLPQDVLALLARVGHPFAWWDDDIEPSAPQGQAFNFANRRHRAALARRLRDANGASDTNDVGETHKPYYRNG